MVDKHEDDLRGKSLKSLKQLSCSSPEKRHLGGSRQDIESVVFVSTSADEMASVPPCSVTVRWWSSAQICTNIRKLTW
ncbi:hypothetical protein TIFTF001_011206 [Ficus carica]|uniref:Uncharacterized protein n=1 Tax=Ficus carica TaxID=3494 RepID=A0AA87ZT46_FICCA|nr:hypothetical protein TIFTF001_011206 [Ficus carica]